MLSGCRKETEIPQVEQWTTFEISLQGEKNFENPYTNVDVWAEFKNDKGIQLRPAFWDGGQHWKIRFAS